MSDIKPNAPTPTQPSQPTNQTNQDTKPTGGATPATNASNPPVSQPNGQENASKSAEAVAPAATEGKHSLTYVGGGVWTDATGVQWAREESYSCIASKTMTDKELSAREDLKFMIKYGAMRDVVV